MCDKRENRNHEERKIKVKERNKYKIPLQVIIYLYFVSMSESGLPAVNYSFTAISKLEVEVLDKNWTTHIPCVCFEYDLSKSECGLSDLYLVV